MRRGACVILAGLLTLAQSGCLALAGQVGFWVNGVDWVDDFPEFIPMYLGTQLNVESLKQLPTRPWGGRCDWPPVFALFDVVPSFCVDTALLPITAVETAYMAVRHWTSPRTCSCEATDPP